MLKRTNLRALAETVGLVPSLAEATAAAEQRRQALTDAQQAIDAARVNLDSLHDTGAPAGDITKAEATLADARLTADRAQRSCNAAERRLIAAREAEQSTAKAAAIVKRDAALATYSKAAAEIDRLSTLTAAQVQIIDEAYPVFSESQRDHVAGLYTRVSGDALAKLGLDRAIAASAGVWTGDKPSASDAAERVTGAILANAHG